MPRPIPSAVTAEKVDPIDAALKAWHDAADQDERVRMAAAIDAFERAEEIANTCDEPGCTRTATCGWPTFPGGNGGNGGYRRTCSDHWIK